VSKKGTCSGAPRLSYSLVVLVILLLSPSFSFADFSGRVVGVSDGDTIKVMHGGKAEKIRLHGIDCPERNQAFGTRAKQFTSEMVFGKTVTIHVTDMDRYGRTVADVIMPDGRVLNRELVTAGLAWWYRKYAPHDLALGRLEEEARTAKRGLWADPDPIPPWKWRKARKAETERPGD
jgi:endonuclease YncB( thermonuclease family)